MLANWNALSITFVPGPEKVPPTRTAGSPTASRISTESWMPGFFGAVAVSVKTVPFSARIRYSSC